MSVEDIPATITVPAIGIRTQDLIDHVDHLLDEARCIKDTGYFGAVNWADLGIADIEYRLSVIYKEAVPFCVVTVSEASPECKLATWLNVHLDTERFPRTYIECEW